VTGRTVALVAGPAAGLTAFLFATYGGLPPTAQDPTVFTAGGLKVAGVAAWMAIWWVSEALPLGATSLLPLALFPLLGVASAKATAAPYMSPFIVLLMAGFMAALSLERWDLHRRMALRVLLAVGTSPRRLVLGTMVAAAGASMWISNTATTLMMLPLVMALAHRARARADDDPEALAAAHRFAMTLALGLAYAASVGGLGTPIGTPPNLIFLGAYRASFPDRDPISFLDFMRFGVPLVAVFVPIIWWLLVSRVGRLPRSMSLGGRELIREELAKLGPFHRDQLTVAVVFAGMAALWVTRRFVTGSGEAVGWAPALGLTGLVDDSTVAVLGAVLLFALPSKTQPGVRLLDWETARKIPWGVVLLFGGGITLAHGFQASGLSATIAAQLTGLHDAPPALLVGTIALAVTFLTEVTSNTATATILMPVLAAFAVGADLNPMWVMLPAAFSASCAFMLPVATAPNAIVYGTGEIPIRSMARTGLVINLLGAALITAWTLLVV